METRKCLLGWLLHVGLKPSVSPVVYPDSQARRYAVRHDCRSRTFPNLTPAVRVSPRRPWPQTTVALFTSVGWCHLWPFLFSSVLVLQKVVYEGLTVEPSTRDPYISITLGQNREFLECQVTGRSRLSRDMDSFGHLRSVVERRISNTPPPTFLPFFRVT